MLKSVITQKKLHIDIKNKEKKSIIISYIIYIFKNANILSINIFVIANMQMNLHFD